MLALIVATGYVAGDWTLHRSFLSVQHVELTGVVHESSNYVMAVSGLDHHPAMIDVSDVVIERRLERLTWIRYATVTKKWPSTIRIVVRERTPVAVVYDAHHRLERIDGTGHALDVVAQSTNLPLLEVVGRGVSKPWPFAPWSNPAAQVAGLLPAHLAAQVAAVRVTRQGQVSLRLTSPLTFLLGSATQLPAKFQSVASVIAASAANNVALRAGDVIDVSVPGTLTVSGP